MRRSRTRLLAALAATLVVAVEAGAVWGSSDASASSQRSWTKVKFVLVYHGNVSGTWRQTRPVIGGLTCIGNDLSGTFTSSVRPGTKPYNLTVYKEFGRHLYLDWRPQQPMGVVTSNRTAQGWLMRYSGGECHQVPIDESGCGAHTFAAHVGLLPDGGSFEFSHNRVYLDWEAEPLTLGCNDGIFYDSADGTRMGQHFGKMVVKTLWRCGIRKGRRCTITIGRSSDYPFQVTQQEETYTSKVHVDWSVTFRVISRR